jgi:hypothetical protein
MYYIPRSCNIEDFENPIPAMRYAMLCEYAMRCDAICLHTYRGRYNIYHEECRNMGIVEDEVGTFYDCHTRRPQPGVGLHAGFITSYSDVVPLDWILFTDTMDAFILVK